MAIEYEGGTNTADERDHIAALEGNEQPRGMTQQDVECAYYAEHGKPWGALQVRQSAICISTSLVCFNA